MYGFNEVLDPKTDTVFKKLFEDKDTLLQFINDVTDIGAVSVSELGIQESNDFNKTIRLDVSVKLNTGELVNVEMQKGVQTSYLDRALYYSSRLYSTQKADLLYNNLNKVIGIHVLNFSPHELDDRLVNRFRMVNDIGNKIIDKMDLYFINLKSKVNNNTNVTDWKNLFTRFDDKELLESSRIKRVYNKLETLSLSTVDRAKYEAELKRIWDEEDSAHALKYMKNKMNESEKKAEEAEKKAEEAKKRAKEEELKRKEEEIKRKEEEIKRKEAERKLIDNQVKLVEILMSQSITFEEALNYLEIKDEVLIQNIKAIIEER